MLWTAPLERAGALHSSHSLTGRVQRNSVWTAQTCCLKVHKSVAIRTDTTITTVNVYPREDGDRAIRTLNGYGYGHLILKVEWAAPREAR